MGSEVIFTLHSSFKKYNMEQILSVFEYDFFRNAVLGCLLASIVCGIVGTYVVTRRLVFISGGITHASFGGIGLAVFLGSSPLLGAMAFAVASALGVQWLSARRDVRQDSAIAMFWTFGMSVGIIFSYLTPGFVTDMSSYLFGSLLTIGTPDLVVLATLAVTALAVFSVFRRVIVAVAFDSQFARTQRLPVSIIEYGMMMLIAVTIVAALRIMGVVMVISLLTIPQITANLFTHNFSTMMLLSIIVSMVFCLAGFCLSFCLSVPSGAAIILVSVVGYAVARLIVR